MSDPMGWKNEIKARANDKETPAFRITNDPSITRTLRFPEAMQSGWVAGQRYVIVDVRPGVSELVEDNGDNGRSLALSLTSDHLAEIGKTLAQVKRAFDPDEDAGGSYRIEHDEMCPANALHARDPYCVCGMASTLKALIEACALMELAREQVRRVAEGK